MGREDPIEFYIYDDFFVGFSLYCFFYFAGAARRFI